MIDGSKELQSTLHSVLITLFVQTFVARSFRDSTAFRKTNLQNYSIKYFEMQQNIHKNSHEDPEKYKTMKKTMKINKQNARHRLHKHYLYI